jgi:hypothetical protein
VEQGRGALAGRARWCRRCGSRGVVGAVLSFAGTAGVNRIKTLSVERLEHAAEAAAEVTWPGRRGGVVGGRGQGLEAAERAIRSGFCGWARACRKTSWPRPPVIHARAPGAAPGAVRRLPGQGGLPAPGLSRVSSRSACALGSYPGSTGGAAPR